MGPPQGPRITVVKKGRDRGGEEVPTTQGTLMPPCPLGEFSLPALVFPADSSLSATSFTISRQAGFDGESAPPRMALVQWLVVWLTDP